MGHHSCPVCGSVVREVVLVLRTVVEALGVEVGDTLGFLVGGMEVPSLGVAVGVTVAVPVGVGVGV